jgi:hypothetical protein
MGEDGTTRDMSDDFGKEAIILMIEEFGALLGHLHEVGHLDCYEAFSCLAGLRGVAG